MIKSPEQLNITPGAWTCEEHSVEFGTYVIPEVRKEWDVVDQAYANATDDAAIEKADALDIAQGRRSGCNRVLIAAAPELYAALHDLVTDLVELGWDRDADTGEEYPNTRNARELLEKISDSMGGTNVPNL